MGDPASAQPSNGTRAAAPELLNGPSNAAKAAARIRAGREATLAALESGGEAKQETALKARATNTEQAPEPKPETPALPEPPTEAEPEAETPEGEEPTEVKPDPAPAATEADPEANKRLGKIQAQEKRSRDKIAKEREQLAADKAKLEQDRQQVAAERAELEAFKKAKERAKLDPVAYLEAGGVDDFDYASRQAFARAKAATNPENREAAARLMRERETETKVERIERELAETKQMLAQRDQQQAFEASRGQYLEHTVKAIDDSAPIAKALAAKNPAKLRAALWQTAERLIEENDGDVPEPEEVIAAYEATRKAELDELGISIPAAKAATETTKQNSQIADKKNPAKTLGTNLSTPRVPRPAKSDREHRAETLAMLERNQLE
jgi:hypothetical protein